VPIGVVVPRTADAAVAAVAVCRQHDVPLLAEHDFDVAGLLVGSESTLITVLRAKLKLVDVLPERSLVVLG
jgi:hypothetical protein